MIEPTVLRGFSEANGSWKIICISRRSPRRSPPFTWVMSRPSNSIDPSVASYKRINTRASVDFPDPLLEQDPPGDREPLAEAADPDERRLGRRRLGLGPLGDLDAHVRA